jgi:hypothetical protein
LGLKNDALLDEPINTCGVLKSGVRMCNKEERSECEPDAWKIWKEIVTVL